MNILLLKKFGNIKKLFPLFILLIFIGFGVYLSTQKKGFELRKKASVSNQSTLSFRAPDKVKVGEKFTVDLILDTTGDPDYTISGVDAVVSYSYQTSSKNYPSCAPRACPMIKIEACKDGEQVYIKPPKDPCDCPSYPSCIKMIESEQVQKSNKMTLGRPDTALIPDIRLLGVQNGTVFDSYPPYYGSDAPKIGGFGFGSQLTTISGVKNYSVDEKGYFKGFSGNGVFATLTFLASNEGSMTLSMQYEGDTATNDTNINGFLANQPASLQKPSERLRQRPEILTINIISAETSPTPPSGCYYENVQCVKVPCIPILVCPSPSVAISQYPSPTPTLAEGCKYYPRPCAQFIREGEKTTDCGMELVCTTPTPAPSAGLKIFVESSDGKPVYREVYVYGQRADINRIYPQVQGAQVYAAGFGELAIPTTSSALWVTGYPLPSPPPLPPPNPEYNKGFMGGLTFLGSGVTNPSGNTIMQIPPQYHNIPWRLFIQTPSHLMRHGQDLSKMVSNNFIFRPNVDSYVRFIGLIPGDIFVSKPGAKQDGIINNFDIADLFSAWGPYPIVQKQPPQQAIPQDLNDDGIVNNRDLAIILSNFGKSADMTGVSPKILNVLPATQTTNSAQ